MRDIKKVLQKVDTTKWFTVALKGKTQRYIVALTHNKNVKSKTLYKQAKTNELLDNVNIWGWKDSETNTKHIDISTSTNNLSFAQTLGKLYKQIAIWDNESMQEIIL